MNTTTVARIFFVHLIANYGFLSRLITSKGPQFVLKFFVAVYSTLGVSTITITECHLQTNGQAKHFNCNLISRIRNYMSENQIDRDTYLLPSTYTYDMQVHRSINFHLSAWRSRERLPDPAIVVQTGHM